MYNSKTQTAINHLDFFVANSPESIFRKLSNNVPNSVEWFTLGMIKRLVVSSASLKVLLTKDGDFERHEFAIGIILRAILLDGLIGLNLLAILKKTSNETDMNGAIEEVDNYCMAILEDSLKSTLRYFEILHKEGIIDSQTLHENFNNFTSTYSEFLEQPGGLNTMPKEKHKLTTSTPTALFRKLSNDSDLKKISRQFFDLYQIYSKYDHFGFLYHRLQETSIEQKIGKVWSAIELFVNHYAGMCDLLDRVTRKNAVIKSMYQSALIYLSERNKTRENAASK